MNLEDISNIIDSKIAENDEKLIFKFYEMKVKLNLSDQELLEVLHLISIRLNNLGYKVYKTGQRYVFENREYTVQSSELFVAVKNKE